MIYIKKKTFNKQERGKTREKIKKKKEIDWNFKYNIINTIKKILTR
jgi:hypothetical protein